MRRLEYLTAACMIATIGVAIYYNERNYRLARENQALAREQHESIKKRMEGK